MNSNLTATQEIDSNIQNQMTMRIGEQQSNISMPAMVADQSMKHQMLSREEWFHGPISRKDAEQLLLEVRRTQYQPYCFVTRRNVFTPISLLSALYIILFFAGWRFPSKRIARISWPVCSYRNAKQF